MSKSIKSFVVISSVFALMLSLSTTLWGGTTGKISGRVTDAATGESLAGANVMIVGTNLGAAADAEGDYFIINVTPGTYEVQSTMIGYQTLTLTEVAVRLDLTTPVNFNLTSTVIVGEAVTVTAGREIIKMDQSSSAINESFERIVTVPLVTDIQQYISLQAGIEGEIIRGGGLDQTTFMLDGMMVVDNRNNQPMMLVNLSSIKEISIIKGGFNAEYGNARSGIINIITKEGDPDRYHGSVDIRRRSPGLKHGGASMFNKDNYYLRPYLDPDVMWDGTRLDSASNLKGGYWDKETQGSYKSFTGWDKYSAKLMADADPNNDRTPEEARDMFMWLHRAEGSEALGQIEDPYGDKPDWNTDVSLSGPVPLIGRFLGNLSFFASYRRNSEEFALPTSREFYTENNANLKLTARLSPNMKLMVEGLYGQVTTVAAYAQRVSETGSYVPGGDDMLWGSLATGGSYAIRYGGTLYWPSTLVPFDVTRSMGGIALDHVLSPSTFYNLRISSVRIENSATGPDKWRDTTTVRYFGTTPMDESPYGNWWLGGPKEMTDGQVYAAYAAGTGDLSTINTVNIKFDLTSQIDKYNQIKAGVLFNYDNINTDVWKRMEYCPNNEQHITWTQTPYRAGAYLQDKLEFEGMIANIGVRLDYSNPNTDWYTLDRYSIYFKRQFEDLLTTEAPTEPAESQLRISPRIGISHPISEEAKLYFNYGHFYSMPTSRSMYTIDYGTAGLGINRIGNPSADLPRTVAYELGLEYNLANMFLLHLSGYYKDVGDQTGNVRYTNYDGTIRYYTFENNHYEDIRGFEVQVDKRYGRWITGWLNYNYMVSTEGFIGREFYYEDLRDMRISGLQNPYQEIPLARPLFRGNLLVTSPEDWGPGVAGIKPLGGIQFSFLYSWKAGRYETWDPLDTDLLQDNVQWKPRQSVDARISKRIQLGESSVSLYVDINNVLDTKYMETQGFSDGSDKTKYLESLHLPMYEGEEYQDQGYEPGDDKPGDFKSDDKDYINDPDRDFLTNLNPRAIFVGLRVDF